MLRNFFSDDAPPSLADLPHVKPEPDNSHSGHKPDKHGGGLDPMLASFWLLGLGCYVALGAMLLNALAQVLPR